MQTWQGGPITRSRGLCDGPVRLWLGQARPLWHNRYAVVLSHDVASLPTAHMLKGVIA